MNPLPRSLLEEAACWRLLSLLFERPSSNWRNQVKALAAEVPNRALREAATAGIREADESVYCSLFGPGGPVPAREASCQPGIQLGYLLAEITGIYRAFGYSPAVEESPDHLAVETGFLAYLKLKQVHAECSGAAEEAQRCSEAVEYFLSRHLSILAFAARGALERGGPAYLALAAKALCERSGLPPAACVFDPPGQTMAEDLIPLTCIENDYGTVRSD